VADPTLYLFDGSNLFHAGGYADRAELVDVLAGYVALRGARGVVVFDGSGADRELGPLSVCHVPDGDALLERLAAEHRDRERVCLVSSDLAVRETSGRAVQKLASAAFLRDVETTGHAEPSPSRVRDRLDEETLARLEQLRRGGT
jgi:predicted RNA-binding protein with PIN domain